METRQNSVQFHRPTFLPMLCSRPSIKNVILPSNSHQEDQKADPLSPKISCIGQVKRSNKIIGFPSTSSSSSSITPAAHNRYFKLKRLFSGKNLTFSAPIATTTTRNSRGRIRKEEFDTKKVVVIDVAELDPPLPVVKKRHDGDGAEAAQNLWKRRSGGGCQLRSLQIQPSGARHLKVTTV